MTEDCCAQVGRQYWWYERVIWSPQKSAPVAPQYWWRVKPVLAGGVKWRWLSFKWEGNAITINHYPCSFITLNYAPGSSMPICGRNETIELRRYLTISICLILTWKLYTDLWQERYDRVAQILDYSVSHQAPTVWIRVGMFVHCCVVPGN